MSVNDLDIETEAMEYALGLMEPQERRAFQADLLDDPDLADAVWDAESLFAPLSAALSERKPSAGVLKNVQKRLFDDVAGQAAAAAAPNKKAKPRRGPTRAGRAGWSGLATVFFATTVAALFVIAVLMARPITVPGPVQVVEVEVPAPAAPTGSQLVAGLAADGAVLVALAQDDGTISLTGLPAVADGDYELWLIPDGQAATSLGLVRPEPQGALAIPAELAGQVVAGTQLAISLEPVGGSTNGSPTGDMVASAAFQPL